MHAISFGKQAFDRPKIGVYKWNYTRLSISPSTDCSVALFTP
jgi:hypothetical protein